MLWFVFCFFVGFFFFFFLLYRETKNSDCLQFLKRGNNFCLLGGRHALCWNEGILHAERESVFFHKLDEACILPLAASAFCVNKDVLRLLGKRCLFPGSLTGAPWKSLAQAEVRGVMPREANTWLLKACCVPGTVLHVYLKAWSHLIFLTRPWGNYPFPYCVDEETKAQRDWASPLKSQSQKGQSRDPCPTLPVCGLRWPGSSNSRLEAGSRAEWSPFLLGSGGNRKVRAEKRLCSPVGICLTAGFLTSSFGPSPRLWSRMGTEFLQDWVGGGGLSLSPQGQLCTGYAVVVCRF